MEGLIGLCAMVFFYQGAMYSSPAYSAWSQPLQQSLVFKFVASLSRFSPYLGI